MEKLSSTRWRTVLCAGLLALSGCGGGSDDNPPPMGAGYQATSLVTDVNGSSNPYSGAVTDAHLVNPWGIAFNPQGFVWVADAGTSSSTLYDGSGAVQSLVVAIPGGTLGAAQPTGIVFSGSSGFVIAQGAASGPSRFLFATLAGTIAAWAPNVDLNNAITVVDRGSSGAAYTGLALGGASGAERLYAADFHHARIDVFDSAFAPVVTAGAFADPALPAGYAPFGVQVIGDRVYVAYALQSANGQDEVAGSGLGVVDAYDLAGALVKRLVSPGGALNAPWGMVMAPADFGQFSNALLVGNLGDGHINAFDPGTGTMLGTLSKPDGSPIAIEGLWGIAFGNGLNNQPTHTLFFAAGPADETHGVYGRIDPQ